MLKRQKPDNITQYIAVDPTRISELHLLGFLPEYLWNNIIYFKDTIDLNNYLKYGIEPIKEEAKKVQIETVDIVKIKEVEETKEKKVSSKKKKESAE